MFNDKIYRWPKGPTNTDFLSSLKIHTKFTKNAKTVNLARFQKCNLRRNSVTRQVNFNWTKNWWKVLK